MTNIVQNITHVSNLFLVIITGVTQGGFGAAAARALALAGARVVLAGRSINKYAKLA